MISTHPSVRGQTNDVLIRCIEACYDCANACTVCADACLGEDMVKDLLQCIRLNLDCADVCQATGTTASRRTGTNELIIKRMVETCAESGDECQKRAQQHEHCRICAETCRHCEQACREAADSITPTLQ